jgi:hypothetical protein
MGASHRRKTFSFGTQHLQEEKLIWSEHIKWCFSFRIVTECMLYADMKERPMNANMKCQRHEFADRLRNPEPDFLQEVSW